MGNNSKPPVVERKRDKKKKGRPSLVGIQKRSLRLQQQDQLKENPNRNPNSTFSPNSSLRHQPSSSGRRVTRRDPNPDASTSGEASAASSLDEDDDGSSDRRREKKIKLVHRLPSSDTVPDPKVWWRKIEELIASFISLSALLLLFLFSFSLNFWRDAASVNCCWNFPLGGLNSAGWYDPITRLRDSLEFLEILFASQIFSRGIGIWPGQSLQLIPWKTRDYYPFSTECLCVECSRIILMILSLRAILKASLFNYVWGKKKQLTCCIWKKVQFCLFSAFPKISLFSLSRSLVPIARRIIFRGGGRFFSDSCFIHY